MNQYITGKTIKSLREKNHMTQVEFAEKIGVSDKTVSKWETGRGYPDITLLQPVADVFKISITELLAGEVANNTNISANMIKTKFYVCPICGNVINTIGELSVSCHGICLPVLEAESYDENHKIFVERVENDYFVQIDHEMSKQHYISFIAAVSFDRIQVVKLYPEGEASTRFPMSRIKKIYFYCNKDGLFCLEVINGKLASYDDTKERRELEATAKMLMG